MNKIFKNNKINSGFTLIETLVALGIFSASIVSLVVVTGSGLSNVSFSKNKITASYLAAEGIEVVRNMRDGAIIADPTAGFANFLTDVNLCVPSNQQISFLKILPITKVAQAQIGNISVSPGCDIDAKDSPITAFSISSCPASGCPLDYDVNHFFTHNIGVESTNFSRVISVEELQQDIEIKITSKVFWQQGGATRNVVMTENLFNWNQPSGTP